MRPKKYGSWQFRLVLCFVQFVLKCTFFLFGNYEIFVFLVCQWISLRWSLHRLLCFSVCSEEAATLDLVAVLGRVEVLHHLLVLLWHKWLSHPANRNRIRKKQILRVDTNEWKRRGCGTGAKLGGNVFRGSGKANGMVSYGMVWNCVVCNGVIWYVWYGIVWYGTVWYDIVWYGMIWYGMVW